MARPTVAAMQTVFAATRDTCSAPQRRCVLRPNIMHAANKPAKITDSQLRSSEHGKGDSDDARARILIPEQYAFPEMIDSITQLVPSGVRRLTTRDVPKYARLTLAQQMEMIAADKAEKEEKARRKAEKAAAKAAAAESGEAPAKPAAKARKKKEDLS
jgi:hypothetical protein